MLAVVSTSGERHKLKAQNSDAGPWGGRGWCIFRKDRL